LLWTLLGCFSLHSLALPSSILLYSPPLSRFNINITQPAPSFSEDSLISDR
jgi:hypothetical protein